MEKCKFWKNFSDKFVKKIKSHDEEIIKKTKLVQDIQAKLINASKKLEQKSK